MKKLLAILALGTLAACSNNCKKGADILTECGFPFNMNAVEYKQYCDAGIPAARAYMDCVVALVPGCNIQGANECGQALSVALEKR